MPQALPSWSLPMQWGMVNMRVMEPTAYQLAARKERTFIVCRFPPGLALGTVVHVAMRHAPNDRNAPTTSKMNGRAMAFVDASRIMKQMVEKKTMGMARSRFAIAVCRTAASAVLGAPALTGAAERREAGLTVEGHDIFFGVGCFFGTSRWLGTWAVSAVNSK